MGVESRAAMPVDLELVGTGGNGSGRRNGDRNVPNILSEGVGDNEAEQFTGGVVLRPTNNGSWLEILEVTRRSGGQNLFDVIGRRTVAMVVVERDHMGRPKLEMPDVYELMQGAAVERSNGDGPLTTMVFDEDTRELVEAMSPHGKNLLNVAPGPFGVYENGSGE